MELFKSHMSRYVKRSCGRKSAIDQYFYSSSSAWSSNNVSSFHLILYISLDMNIPSHFCRSLLFNFDGSWLLYYRVAMQQLIIMDTVDGKRKECCHVSRREDINDKMGGGGEDKQHNDSGLDCRIWLKCSGREDTDDEWVRRR